jgi:hypothetical protein
MIWGGLAAEAGVSQDASDCSVKRAMYERGYSDFIAAETDYVDDKLAARCFKWAEKMLAERPRPEDWHDVRFSDEVHFSYGPEGKVHIKRKRGERYLPDCLGKSSQRKSRNAVCLGLFIVQALPPRKVNY